MSPSSEHAAQPQDPRGPSNGEGAALSAYDLVERARAFLKAGHPHQAAMLLARAKLMEPEKGSIREDLARALYLSGRNARARREFAKAVQIGRASCRERV